MNRENEPKLHCSECESGIYEGEMYYDYDGMTLCRECMLEVIDDIYGKMG